MPAEKAVIRGRCREGVWILNQYLVADRGQALAEHLADILKIDIAPEINGEFRHGEMRHLTSDTTLARSAGYKPTVDLGDGILRYIDWIRKQSDIRDYFSEASDILKNKGIVHRVAR